MNLFETRVMLAVLSQMLPARSFLKDIFFGAIETHTSKHVDIDIIKGKRRVGAYVYPTSQAKLVERIGWTTRTFIPPYIKEKMVTTAQDFLNRNPGDNIYSPGDGPQQRAEAQVAKDLAEMSDMITRSEEVQASQLLNTGIVTVNGEGYDNYQVDFGMSATHKITLTGTDLWTNAASDPIDDFRVWNRLLVKDSGLGITDAIVGSSVVPALMNNTKFKAQLDNRRMDMGLVSPRDMGEGVSFLGRLNEAGIDIWTYDEWYLHPDTGVETPMITANKVYFMSRNARTTTHYGAIQDLQAGGLAAVARFPKSWEKEDPSVRYVMVQSAPLLAMHQVDAFGVAIVTA